MDFEELACVLNPVRPLSSESERVDSLRILFYSHDSWGLGHLRRSLAIASSVADTFPEANTLIVTGSPCATQFRLPPRCDVVKLPAVSKDSDGGYVARNLSLGLAATLHIRERILLETYRAFDPHLIVVDHQLVGLLGECLSMLREAKDRGTKTIYGLRDVLDSAANVQRLWNTPDCRWALAEAYDCICVYGSQEIFDPRVEYPLLNQFNKRLEFTGYISPSRPARMMRPVPTVRPQVVVTCGGGEDGDDRLEKYLTALSLGPVKWDSEIVTGPLMAPRRVRNYKRKAEKLRHSGNVNVRHFHADLPHLLRRADAVVSMAGYNTCTEILQSNCPAVLLPRTHPRQEQMIRAQRISALGLARTLYNPDPLHLRKADHTKAATQSRRIDIVLPISR